LTWSILQVTTPAGLTNSDFTSGVGQYTLQVNNSGPYTAFLQWDEANDIVQLNITAVAVPEPSSALLAGFGALALQTSRQFEGGLLPAPTLCAWMQRLLHIWCLRRRILCFEPFSGHHGCDRRPLVASTGEGH